MNWDQPFGLASPAAWLRRDGVDVGSSCLAATLTDQAIRAADVVGFYLPMHTATRLAAPLIEKVRAVNTTARLCAYGLYAPLNADWLRSLGVEHVLGAEFEEELFALVSSSNALTSQVGAVTLPRLQFLVPDRTGLRRCARPLRASLTMPDGSTRSRIHGSQPRVPASSCRHCPVVPVYNGQFRSVQRGTSCSRTSTPAPQALSHITSAIRIFFNGPTHAMRPVRRAARPPSVADLRRDHQD
jgi:hypothetical protein